MNELLSDHERIYIVRRITATIRSFTEMSPVTIVTGARQVGKSTLLRHEFPDYAYLNLDDFAVLERARVDPAALWKGTERLVIDEAQKAPRLFEAIKLEVDQSNRRKRFLLSGSTDLLLMKGITESLAGRAFYVEMLPMTYGEIVGSLEPTLFRRLWQEDFTMAEGSVEAVPPLPLLLRGFLPPLVFTRGRQEALAWLEGYERTYLERDLRQLSQVDSLVDFRNVMRSLALRAGSTLNQADIAKDTGTSPATAHRYLKLLEVSNIALRVPAYATGRHQRIVKAPKMYIVDPALAVYLAGYLDGESLARSREVGGFFETLVHLHLRALCRLMTPRAQIYHWRTTAGHEVDFILEHGRRLLAVEAKLNEKPTVHDARHLIRFVEEHPECLRGVLLHAGSAVTWLHSRVIAVPWHLIDR